jgi:hypothetical protein
LQPDVGLFQGSAGELRRANLEGDLDPTIYDPTNLEGDLDAVGPGVHQIDLSGTHPTTTGGRKQAKHPAAVARDTRRALRKEWKQQTSNATAQ